MAGINRSFLFQNLIRITSLTYVPHDRTHQGKSVENASRKMQILCSAPSNAAWKAMRTH
jgi:hypothetical protein